MDQLAFGKWSVNDWQGDAGLAVSILTLLLYVRTYWRTAQKDVLKEMREEIERLEEENKYVKEDNRRLERDNARLLRLIARLDQNGSH